MLVKLKRCTKRAIVLQKLYRDQESELLGVGHIEGFEIASNMLEGEN